MRINKTKMVNLPDEGVILLVLPSKYYNEFNSDILHNLINKKNRYCIYLSLNKPSAMLNQQLKKIGVPEDHLFFIDCVTKLAAGTMARSGNTVFVSSPQNLTEIGMVLSSTASSVPAEKAFLFLDTLSTLLLYTSAGNAAIFMHFLISKIRELKMSGVILSITEESDQKIISQITQFCDKRIDF